MVRVDLEKKVLIDLDGRVFTNPLPPELVLEHSQSQFPPSSSGAGWTGATTSSTNTIYIDFGDGSPIYSRQFTGELRIRNDSPIHIYTTAQRYIIRIWFDNPSLITGIQFYHSPYIGDFPAQLGLYSLNQLSVRTTRFQSFPENFLGGVYNSLALNNITMDTINYIPDWIINSRINVLSLTTSFDLSDLNISNLDRLIDIQGLRIFDISACNIGNDSIPDNFKEISTLRTLGLGNNPLTEITQEINDCKQLTLLSYGYRVSGWSAEGSPLFTTWGVGVGNMPNLQRFEWSNCMNAETTLPTGIELSPNLKTLYARVVYRTQERMDEFITNAYELVIDTADITGADNLLRQIFLHLGFISTPSIANTRRPTGTYQPPTGYEEGVSNGTPETPMEMIYVLVNQYKWTITVINEERTANQVYAP